MLYGIILAGGIGQRLWPESDKNTPKPFLSRDGDRTLLEETVDRILRIVPPESVLISVSDRYLEPVKRLIRNEAIGLIAEPVSRNTAPAIALAALRLERIDPEAVMAVFPSDSFIDDPASFSSLLDSAVKLIDEDENRLITIGIAPRSAATGYGYIKAESRLLSGTSLPLTAVAAPLKAELFCEKPDRKTAERYLAEGGFYWNSGIFVWKAKRILNLLSRFVPGMSGHIAGARHSSDPFQSFREIFSSLTPVSIDRAVLEKASDIVLLPAPFRWSDLGTFETLTCIANPAKDAKGNIAVGANLSAVESSGNIVRVASGPAGEPFTVALGGVDRLLVVLKGNKLLIVPQGREDLIRRLAGENGSN